jgi:hypothetical protein
MTYSGTMYRQGWADAMGSIPYFTKGKAVFENKLSNVYRLLPKQKFL